MSLIHTSSDLHPMALSHPTTTRADRVPEQEVIEQAQNSIAKWTNAAPSAIWVRGPVPFEVIEAIVSAASAHKRRPQTTVDLCVIGNADLKKQVGEAAEERVRKLHGRMPLRSD